MKLSAAAALLKAKLQGADAEFTTVSTDTRTLKSGDLFIALQGPKFNGNEFVAEATKKGAVGAIVCGELASTQLPIISVKDTKKALAQLARHQREQVQIPIVAVTGSVGKTTTRAMLASVFRQLGHVLASESSFNNDIGVPLTLMRLRSDQDYAIFELGANHIGEIAHLVELVKPSVAIITNAGPAHLEGFGSLEGVAKAKGEIYQGLKADGIAIVNNDDHFAPFWKTLIGDRRTITFGVKNAADIRATNIRLDAQGHPIFQLIMPNGEIEVVLPLMGEHNVANALAVAAAAAVFNCPISSIKKGLESVEPVKGRLVLQKGYHGATIIDDSYNANPSSVGAAIKVLAKQPGHSILVFGDMRELGPDSEKFHREIGQQALQAGIRQMYCYGPLSRCAVDAFGNNAHHFEDKQALIVALKDQLNKDNTVLIKGSLSMGMAQVAKALLEELN